ncbi:type II pantothenate kinase [Lacicoccus alkaliphilus]|uniref:Pantothenate kinase n=1 Tax=Lacicoccus alkaliphilus DSM 16010 TaxID=1123231 RepID=A0A1M7IF13_9BACL|nr:type II pantothenate kinase [Salinicoccus alkaliphilus]SHM39269.1 pantothenate kinase [Salinicoccus alkaliphilus DSM 16010]
MKIGIDAGGTLLKIVYISEEETVYRKVSSLHIDDFIEELNREHPKADIRITGGKAGYMSRKLNHEVRHSIEFDATYTGLKHLMKEQGIHIDRFVYLNVGTGTSFHQADADGQRRAGGTGVGGGTLMGLSYLLTGVRDFKSIISLAKEGNRDAIDLKVHHIYAGDASPIPGDLTASNFGNVQPGDREKARHADELQAVIGLVAETVSTIGINLAAGFDTEDIIFIGSTLLDNDVMIDIINHYVSLKGMKPHFIENGEFSGALGVLLS